MDLLSKVIYSYAFSFSDLLPLKEMQRIAEQQSAMQYFVFHALMEESLMGEKEEARVLAESAGEKADEETRESYTLTYYNPETHKAEVLKAKADVRMKDHVSQMVEESVGLQSAYPLYRFIGSPIMRQEIVPWRLQQILSEREYGTPPPSGAGAPVVPVRVIEKKRSEIVAREKHDEELRAALAEAVMRKERSEIKVDEEIALLEEAIDALEKGDDLEAVLKGLPPLSRARYLVALKKLGLNRQAIMRLLVRDALFLKKLKKKLETFTLDDLIGVMKILKELKKPTS